MDISQLPVEQRRPFPIYESVIEQSRNMSMRWSRKNLLDLVHEIGLVEKENPSATPTSDSDVRRANHSNASYASLQSVDVQWLPGPAEMSNLDELPALNPHGIDGLPAGLGSLWLESARVYYVEENHTALPMRGFSWVTVRENTESSDGIVAVFIHHDPIDPASAMAEMNHYVLTSLGPILPVGRWGGTGDWVFPSPFNFPEIGTLANTIFSEEEFGWPPAHPALRVLQHALLHPSLETFSFEPMS